MNLQEYTYRVLPAKDKLYRFALCIVGNTSEAEDIVQEVFLRVWEQRDSTKNIENIDAWCMRMVKNLSIDKMRAKSKQNVALDTQLPTVDQQANPHQKTEISDTIRHIETFIQMLPEKQRMVIQLRDIEGMTYQEIALILDISIDQVKVNLHRARRKIRQQLVSAEAYGIKKINKI